MIASPRLVLLATVAALLAPGRPATAAQFDVVESARARAVAVAAPSTRTNSVGPALRTPVDSAAAELAAGRPWHAARLLQAAHPGGAGLDAAGRLVLARAESGARNWAGVLSALEPLPPSGTADGERWRLRGRALEEQGRWQEAVDAYALYLATPQAAGSEDAPAILARQVRVLAQLQAWDRAITQLGTLRAQHGGLADWTALTAARSAVAPGQVSVVRTLVATLADPAVRRRAWDLEPRVLLAAGDTAAALTALSSAVTLLGDAPARAEALLLTGEVLRQRRDATGARAALLQALSAGGTTAVTGRTARQLLELGGLDAALTLRVARALDAAGDATRALQAYDLYVRDAPAAVPADARLARARLMAQVPARHDRAVDEFRELSALPAAEIGAVALDQWARLRDRQSRTADALTLRNRLIERFPASVPASEVMFLRGDAAHDRGALGEAVAEYRRLAEAAPSLDRAGLARMRWGQIHLLRGERAEAAAVFEGYLAAFPTGRRWEEATYWAAHARLGLGERTRAEALLAELRAREPFGYYSVLAAELVGQPYRIDLPAGEEPPFSAWVQDGLRTLDLVDAAGLADARTATVEALRARAREADPADGLRLSEELTRRGQSLAGINLGWELRERGMPWSTRLLQAVYPFPQRERIEREAREWGADPLLVAALIRQESAWEPAIRSPVGATGLMQVMPETGRELAARHGVAGFRPEQLEVPDLNTHLGTAFLVELLARYRGDLPLALSGYNAGPQRADRWRSFPEAADPLRLTERIPFAETRDYVKRVYRNRVLYEALYGRR